jgi:hypothetical protein
MIMSATTADQYAALRLAACDTSLVVRIMYQGLRAM